MAASFPLRRQAAIDLDAPPAEVFARLDDHRRLAAHMQSSSMLTGGGSMRLDTDERQGQAVGSRLRLSGRAFGIELAVEEAVTEYEPPRRKVWQTLGEPRLLVIGAYRMGFELQPRARGGATRVTMSIEWALPRAGLARWLGRLFGGLYARWCLQQMLGAARE